MIPRNQLSIADIFSDCREILDLDKPRFLDFLENHIHLDKIAPASFLLLLNPFSEGILPSDALLPAALHSLILPPAICNEKLSLGNQTVQTLDNSQGAVTLAMKLPGRALAFISCISYDCTVFEIQAFMFIFGEAKLHIQPRLLKRSCHTNHLVQQLLDCPVIQSDQAV